MEDKAIQQRIRRIAGSGGDAESIWETFVKLGEPTLRDLRGLSEEDAQSLIDTELTVFVETQSWLINRVKGKVRLAAAGTLTSPFEGFETPRERAEAAALASRADMLPKVLGFRNDVLNGRLLTPSQAFDFLKSPAISYFGLDTFRTAGVTLHAHEATLITGDDPALDAANRQVHFVSVWIDPPGITWSLAIRPGEGLDRYVRLPYPLPERVWPTPGSVLWQLDEVVDTVLDIGFPESPDATMFILTGQIPRYDGIYLVEPTSGTTANRINLSIDPWVSVEDVKDVYLREQAAIQMTTHRVRLGRYLDVFRFVMERRMDRGPKGAPQWKKWTREWNERYPRDSYGLGRTAYENFRSDYGRAERQLFHKPTSLRAAIALQNASE